MPPGIYPALFSGSGGISSAAVPDPYVPVDGTMNVTGGVATSGAVSVGTHLLLDGNGNGTFPSASDAGWTADAGLTNVVGNIGTGGVYALQANNSAAGAINLFPAAPTASITTSSILKFGTNGVLIDGSADTVQLTVQGHSTQTTLPFVVENSAGTDQFTVSNTGVVVALGPATVGSATATNAIVTGDQTLGATYPSIRNANENATTGWALAASSGGNTYLNGRVGLEFNISNVQKAVLNGSGLMLNSGMGLAVGGVTAVKTTDYVATVADFLVPVDVNTTGDVAITLPAASAAKGQILHIKATATHATRDINVNRAGADTIYTSAAAAQTTVQLSPSATLSSLTLVSDGVSAWFVTQHTV